MASDSASLGIHKAATLYERARCAAILRKHIAFWGRVQTSEVASAHRKEAAKWHVDELKNVLTEIVGEEYNPYDKNPIGGSNA